MEFEIPKLKIKHWLGIIFILIGACFFYLTLGLYFNFETTPLLNPLIINLWGDAVMAMLFIVSGLYFLIIYNGRGS